MIRYGCAWYPEQWPEETWSEDLRLMKAAGMNVARIAEFAWSRMEPAEGRYDLGWLARAADLAAQYGVAIVLGTPTATPPAWLTQSYPDVLAVDPNGHRAQHGARCHYNPCSARYREFCRRIASAMAERFASHPNVIGWQIDNEYWRVSYDEETRGRFQAWLRERYGSLEAVNRAWATTYWSQEYGDWSQIPFPAASNNPGLLLAFRRFMTAVYADYQRIQRDAIRAYAGDRQWITHNAHAHESLDWLALAQELDRMSYDPYLGGEHLDFAAAGWLGDMCRCAKPGRAHWVMETQPGFVNWGGVNSTLDRGETRRFAWHHVAHGAEAVLFWEWRNALNGQEQYHGTLLAADGTPRPLYEEVAQAGGEFARVADALAGAPVPAPVALLYTYPDRWALKEQPHHRDFDATRHLCAYYRPLREAGVDVDVLDPRLRDIGTYALLVAPHLHILTDDVAARLAAYVRGGGHLLLGARSGFKDEHNAMLPSRQPGPVLRELLGACVEEFYALASPAPVGGTLGQGQASTWAEPLRIEADDVEVLLSYGAYNGWLDGKPAAVRRRVGRGSVAYCGAWLDAKLLAALVAAQRQLAGVEPPLPSIPAGVEICRRHAARGSVLVVINHTREAKSVPLPGPATDLLSGREHRDVLPLPPNGVAVLAG